MMITKIPFLEAAMKAASLDAEVGDLRDEPSGGLSRYRPLQAHSLFDFCHSRKQPGSSSIHIKLEPSQWHEGSFAVEDRFARDLAALLTEEGFDCVDVQPQSLTYCRRAMQGRGFTGCLARWLQAFRFHRSENDHNP